MQITKFKILLFLLTIVTISNAQKIDISIFNSLKIKTIIVNPLSGKYILRADNTKLELNTSDVYYISVFGDDILVKSIEKEIGKFRSIKIEGISKINNIRVKPVLPEIKERTYDDNLFISINNGKLQIVNNVELESYIAGVVEAEGGSKAPVEYYKSQAIICRTYALNTFKRHANEGFNMCDEVHCQAYKGKCHKNIDIIKATVLTKGLIIVDTTLNLITAAFHSNCGGHTVNSEDVWVSEKSYLKASNDPYCCSSRNATWEKSIPLKDWIKYMKINGMSVSNNNLNTKDFKYNQSNRRLYYSYKGDSLPLKSIRTDWKLRSTYFSITPNGDNLTLKGKGYGHGIGLCQEGAMQMARESFKYDEIIKFYYKNTYTISLQALEFFKEPVDN